VDEASSGSCSVVVSGISSIEHLGLGARELPVT
jgi:hypothetical protein